MDSYIGSIFAFGFNYAPYGWFMCQGQILPINQYAALFSVLGTQYGGNGTSTFGLPNLQSRTAIGQGQGPNLTEYVMGENVGVENVTLTALNMPAHTHAVTIGLNSSADGPNTGNPTGNFPSTDSGNGNYSNSTNGLMAGSLQATLGNAGSMTNPVNVDSRRSMLAMNYCIAMDGVFPTRP